MQTITERLLASVGAERVFSDCGIDLALLRGAREGSIPCSLHREQRGESLSLDLDRGLWHCFGSCQSGGDLVTLYGRVKGIEPGPALYKAVEEQYLGNGHARPNLPVPVKPALPRLHPALSECVERAFSSCKAIPGVPELYEVRSYSSAQGSGLVFLIRDPATGLACDIKRRQIRPKPDPRFKSVSMAPYCVRCRKPTSRAGECLKDHPEEVARAKAGLFGYKALLSRKGRVLLAAGEKDALSGAQAFLHYGIIPCSWSAGEGTNPEGLPALLKDRDALVLYDADEAGQKAGPERVAYLRGQGVRAALVPWLIMDPPLKEGQKDLYDWLLNRPVLREAAGALLGLRCATAEELAAEKPAEPPKRREGPPVPTEAPPQEALDLDKNQPDDIASQYLMSRYMTGSDLTLRFWRGDFYLWRDVSYAMTEKVALRAPLSEFLRSGGVTPKKGLHEAISFFMEGRCVLPAEKEPPYWCGSAPDLPTSDLIPFSNGLLDPVQDDLLPHTPGYFNIFSLPFPYDPNAKEPIEWLRFLSSVFPSQPESVALLQEIFGYLLTPDHRYQKFFAFIGVKNSGKSTVVNVLRKIVGEHNCTNPQLSDLVGPFGLEPLLGKTVAVFEEAAIDKARQGPITDIVKSLTAGNPKTVNRKNKVAWSGVLPARFITISNAIPDWLDYSGALQRRIIPLRFTVDFERADRVDPNLEAKLLPEATGIINWALEGRARLRQRGRFQMGRDSLMLWGEIEARTNKMRPFIMEYLELGETKSAPLNQLYGLYRGWAERAGLGKSSLPSFHGNLRSAIPTITEEVSAEGIVTLRGIGVIPGKWAEAYPQRRDSEGLPYED